MRTTHIDSIILALAAFIAGIFMRSFFPTEKIFFSLLFLLLAVTAAAIATKQLVFGQIVLIIFALALGIMRTDMMLTASDNLRSLRDTEETITITGIVIWEPDVREQTTRLMVAYAGARILVTLPHFPAYAYGDKLELTGTLQTPEVFPDFNYKNFLQKDRIFTVMRLPKTTLLSQQNGNVLYARVLSFKNSMRSSIDRLLPTPQNTLLKAIILGDKNALSETLKEKLNITGLRHITAISGMHIAIFINLLMLLFVNTGLWRGQAFYATLAVVVIYILMIGAPPSAIRAGIMGILAMIAEKAGRPQHAFRFLLIAAVGMLVINPLLLTRDIGFQLSFLAVLGIIYLVPFFSSFLSRFVRHTTLRNTVAMTFAAQIFTLPLLVYNFGRISLLAPLTNVLIVPLLGFVLIGGFVGVVAGLLNNTIGIFAAFPVYVLLSYISAVINISASVPFASVALQNVPWFWLLFYVLFIIVPLSVARSRR